jgi:hypothetical protein
MNEMKTKFTTLELSVGNGHTFWLDGNSKITGLDGTYDEPSANALSYPAPDCCPMSTPTCRKSCYTIGLHKYDLDMATKYRHNLQTLAELLANPREASRAAEELGAYMSRLKGFRWHVSGDVVAELHAKWISLACHNTTTPSWIYTRSLYWVKHLQAPTLTVNISADKDNYTDAKHVASLTGARLCYLSTDLHDVPTGLPDGSVLFPDYPARGRELEDPTEHPWWQLRTPRQRKMVCPADFFGQSELIRCGKCTKCMQKE